MRNFDYLKNVPVELVVDPEAIRLFDLSTEPEEPAVATDVYDGTTWLSDGWKPVRVRAPFSTRSCRSRVAVARDVPVIEI